MVETISDQLRRRGISNAAIVSLIGAVEGCCVSVMPKGDALQDILTEYAEPFEMSGTGEVKDGNVHIHCVMGGENGTVSGHLHWAKVENWFVNAYVIPV